MSFFQRLLSSLRGPGLGATLVKLRALLVDHWFDVKYGVDTCGESALEALTIQSGNKALGYRYQPTRVLPLRRLFERIKPMLPANGVLVDFGSGKGRILLVAPEFGFREVRGVEFAHELCEVARRNCAVYKARTGVATEFRIIEADAARYAIRPEENLFIMYNPFDEAVLSAVLDNIAASVDQQPRRILIIYYNPKWSQTIEQRREFARMQELTFWGYKFMVYSNRD